MKTWIYQRSYTHNLSSSEKKKFGLNGIQTHDLCDTGSVNWAI